MKRLRDYLDSEYVKLTRPFSKDKSKEQILVYVEGDSDIPFWEFVLGKYTDFRVNVTTYKIPAQKENEKDREVKGKDYLMKVAGLGKNKMVCVDADFDLLVTNNKYHQKLTSDTYVVNTIYYAKENILASPERLEKIANNHRSTPTTVDYAMMLKDFSIAVEPVLYLLLASTKEYNNKAAKGYTLKDFNMSVNTINPVLKDNSVSKLKYMRDEETLMQQKHDAIQEVKDETYNIIKGVDNLYRYVNGHTLFSYVGKLLRFDIRAGRGRYGKDYDDEVVKKELYSNKYLSYNDIPNEIYVKLDSILHP